MSYEKGHVNKEKVGNLAYHPDVTKLSCRVYVDSQMRGRLLIV